MTTTTINGHNVEIPTPARAAGHSDAQFCSRACGRCDAEMTRRSRKVRAAITADAFGPRGSKSWQLARAAAS